ncbi:MAG: PKD domain-containing protein [Bacteroidales bacterium]|nr:PKD domain-containing protein [Bacteroidales bacterium]MCF8402355.1 PKD domain-containing protein [Bacteroidales bacterium]
MKRTITIISVLWIVFQTISTNFAISQVCCPEFRLNDAIEVCPPEGACRADPVGGQSDAGLVACNESAHTYTVFPNDPSFTYTWSVTGGTPTTFTGNPNTIVWGTGSSGYIKVIISNLNIGGNCIDSIMQPICLIEGPQADFTLSPDTVCQNTPVYFTNTSLGGSVFFWDFGDGNTSNLANPPAHSYASPGTYIVTLTAQDMGAGQWVITQEPPSEVLVPCGCIDTISKVVVVLPGQGPEIETDCCYGTVCPGDTSYFCTPSVCTTYNWTVAGGTIISGLGSKCIEVKWNSTYSGPTIVSLELPGCGSAPCPGTTTLQVPVLYPNLPISGPVILCAGASGSYSLPSLPGTYYNWSVSGGLHSFNNVDKNAANVSITFNYPGTYWVKCDYDNPLAGCSGIDSLQVDILPEFEFFGDETVCEGSTISYFANGPANWFVTPAGPGITGNGTNTANVTWPTGTYTLTAVPVNPANFCNASAFKQVEVIAKPILNNIIGPDSICPGKNFTYSISSNVSGSPFVWNVTSGTGTILSEMGADKDSIVVKWAGPGPWQLSVYQEIEISPGVFCQSLAKTHTVNSYLPPNITGLGSVCVDGIESYSAGGSNLSGNFEWSIIPASQGSIQTGQGSNGVTILWHGTPNTAIIKVITCSGMDTIPVTILNPPVKPTITPSGPVQYCSPAVPNNLSLSVPTGYASYQWFLNGVFTGGTSNTYLIPNGSFTGAGAYIFTVTVSNGLCSVSSSILILIGDCGGTGSPPNPIACDIDFSMNPNPACVGQKVTFAAIPTISGFQYAWDFGDASTSFTTPTSHIYNSPGTYSVKLTATLGNICIVDTTKTITINPLPSCTLMAADTIFCPGDSLALTASCPGMSSYQWYKDGSAISGANFSTYYVKQHGEYWAEVANNFGCYNLSDSLYIYMHSLPVAKIDGERSICANTSSTVQVFLNTIYNVDYSYSWSSIPGGATFTPSTDYYTFASLTLPAVLPVTYQFVVDVTDNNTGCINSDTICVTFYENPPLSVPYLNACEGGTYTLTPTPNDPVNYSYQWNNGATTPVINVFKPGYYSLTITDKANGCSTTQAAGFIHAKPDLSLFPLGCDDICLSDTFHLYIPLPLEAFPPNNTYPTAYPTITWYANGNYGSPIGTGENLAYNPGIAGNYQISVVVQNTFGCLDTAGVFCLGVDTTVTVAVSTVTPCGCDSTLSFYLVNANNEFDFISVSMKSCEETFTLCVDAEATYNLQASNGIFIPNAIVNGVVTYPGGMSPFMIGDNGLCCFAYADSLYVKILAPVNYTTDVVWDGKYYIDDNVIVTVSSGAVLDITNVDVVFGECAGIVFQDSSYLRSNNSVYRPCNIDKTWKGLRFTGIGEFDNIINECTFKNAEVALYFQNGSDAVISNNLFSNCNYGVRVEGNNAFDHPISGNRFVTEQFFPDFACDSVYTFVNNSSTYGIYSTTSRFVEQVSHNEFLNTWGSDFPRTYGIYQHNGGGLFSENIFTDMSYSVLLSSALFPTNLENNTMEVNEPAIFSLASVYIDNSVNPVIEINNNKLANNTNQYNSFAAIYARNSANISMVKNTIDGFNYGIIGVLARNFQISYNEINDCNFTGIYFFSANANVQNFITCNNIKMRNFNNTRGLFTINLSTPSIVSNNCITDCYTCMDFRAFTSNMPLPLIRNNFLYNYNHVGIHVQGHSGDIGTNADPGLNTLYSNDNSAVDINSTSSITVADNFGMFNISWPQVQITSNNPYHSTASCAHQIFNMPSQGNLNISYTCDHYAELLDPLKNYFNNFGLAENYQEMLKSSDQQFQMANLILSTFEGADEGLLNEIISVTNLTANEVAVLKYNFYFAHADFDQARFNLMLFTPANNDEADYQLILSLNLDVVENGWDNLSFENIMQLEMIRNKAGNNSNAAVMLLNNTSTYRDYFEEKIDLPEVVKSEQIKHIGENESYLNIYPNPATNIAFIELIHNAGIEGNLQVHDVSGKRISDIPTTLVAGGLEMDISKLKQGFYFISLTDANSGFIQIGKLVKIDD